MVIGNEDYDFSILENVSIWFCLFTSITYMYVKFNILSAKLNQQFCLWICVCGELCSTCCNTYRVYIEYILNFLLWLYSFLCLLCQNTLYKGDYYRYHPTIKLFWEVFHDFSLENKKKFLCEYFYVSTRNIWQQGSILYQFGCH
jgi:hypothetical protein